MAFFILDTTMGKFPELTVFYLQIPGEKY